jgi:VWFA-related protein
MRRAVGFVGALLLAQAPLAAQGEAPRAQVFEEAIDVRVVNVETVIVDSHGNPVRGLTVGDFRLLIDGTEVPIEYFTEVVEGTAAAAEVSGTPATAPVAVGEEVGRNYLVYIDESFSVASIRDEILKKLERDLVLLTAADRMAVLAFDGTRIVVLSGWTDDRAALKAALEQARRRPALGNQLQAYQRKLQQDVDWILDNASSIDDGDSSGPSIIGLALDWMSPRISPEARTQLGKTAPATASALRGFEPPPGRKVMLLLSGAWSLRVAPRLYGPLIQAANDLGYTLYPVDVAQSDATEVSLLDGFARETGGRVVVSAKLEAFRAVVVDSGTYYWIGFAPSWKADDRGHRITVETRRPDLAVRSRSGFSDLSPRTANAMKAEGVLLFGGAERDRRLIVQLGEPRRWLRGEVEVPVILGVPVESLSLTPKGRGFVAEAPVAASVLDDRGGRADLPGSRLRVALDGPPLPGTYARFQMIVKLSNAPQRLVFTVHDPVNVISLWGQADFKPRPKR